MIESYHKYSTYVSALFPYTQTFLFHEAWCIYTTYIMYCLLTPYICLVSSVVCWSLEKSQVGDGYVGLNIIIFSREGENLGHVIINDKEGKQVSPAHSLLTSSSTH